MKDTRASFRSTYGKDPVETEFTVEKGQYNTGSTSFLRRHKGRIQFQVEGQVYTILCVQKYNPLHNTRNWISLLPCYRVKTEG